MGTRRIGPVGRLLVVAAVFVAVAVFAGQARAAYPGQNGQISFTNDSSGSPQIARVNPDGSVSNCRVARSSGDPSIDGLMCELTLRYIRFDPARDPNGRAVAQDVTFFPNWWRS